MRRVNNLLAVPLNDRRPVYARLKSQHMTVPDTFAPTDALFQEQYEMRLTVACRFWANSAQMDNARAAAKRCLVAELYRDLFALIREAELRLSEDDTPGALVALAAIRAEVTGESDEPRS